MIHNIRPGPMIMRDNPTFIYYIAALLFISVVALWIAGIILAKPMTKILKVPKVYLMPIVAALSIVGAMPSTTGPLTSLSVWCLVCSAIFWTKCSIPLPPSCWVSSWAT